MGRVPTLVPKVLVISAQRLAYLKFGEICVPKRNHRSDEAGPSGKPRFWMTKRASMTSAVWQLLSG